MSGRATVQATDGLSVLLVDSDPGFLSWNCQLIAEDGHRAWGAEDLIAAANFLADQTPQLLVVEVALLDMDGADPLGDLRERAPGAPIVLTATGAPDDRFRSFCRAHDIFGYHDKEHGSDALRLWVRAALVLANQSAAVRRTRSGLQRVLDAVPELHRLQSIENVLEAILAQVGELVGGHPEFVAARLSDPIGKPRLEEGDSDTQTVEDFVVGAVTNDSVPHGATLDQLPKLPASLLKRAVEEGEQLIDGRHGVLPLTLAEHVLGLAYLSRPAPTERDADLLRVYAAQAASAIRNAALYELATIDATTRVFRKAFTLERLSETLKLAWRKEFPVSVVMIDIDHFRDVNEQYGHVAGDRALRHLGQLLRRNVRDSDIVGRFGGDEFLVVLIDANQEGAHTAVQRLYGALGRQSGRPWPDSLPQLTVSMGVASMEPGEEGYKERGLPGFDGIVERLVSEADGAMFRARLDPRSALDSPVLTWTDFS
ncbi:MAG: diguanylate cyclase [Gemmatimonadetes bacterium]|uniref:diguanylate cyclase n=1 Tax=Candidatus Kutchimonas denitrificans TaxID=3056748 RepID=A0AAE4Z983_9BACT|nr:diguanylate cyclase [Gemmatimonadota bacterium]NIR74496.1 diguanylate cyclase [Candidatus Kutchimonas denitrificans]NIS02686.1 diguanylate cyclase [Gemmatimonadota bacterium]NIT68847.1 diguanylate cyclase [Gemmatimonadota bacterium]NIU52152.1 diguanylate cyclase [Gemmatimonadota bacterium]